MNNIFLLEMDKFFWGYSFEYKLLDVKQDIFVLIYVM